jgi:hypothetical protein
MLIQLFLLLKQELLELLKLQHLLVQLRLVWQHLLAKVLLLIQ